MWSQQPFLVNIEYYTARMDYMHPTVREATKTIILASTKCWANVSVAAMAYKL